MLLNEHVAVCTSQVVLVPYSKHHVPKYHEWMKDPDIQQTTASDPLTIEEEYAMQKSWRLDADKLTFITSIPTTSLDGVRLVVGCAGYTMVGDVNLFIITTYDENTEADALVGEFELMVAEKSAQGQGLGRAAIVAFLQFVVANEEGIVAEYRAANETVQKQKLDYFRVKIGKDNERSLKLFAGLGFTQIGEVSYFGEIELRSTLCLDNVEALRERFGLEEAREIRFEDQRDEDTDQLRK